MRRSQERLRRNAAGVQAIASELTSLGQRHARTKAGGGMRRHQAGGAAADHDEVVCFDERQITTRTELHTQENAACSLPCCRTDRSGVDLHLPLVARVLALELTVGLEVDDDERVALIERKVDMAFDDGS
jgi:hypothetical protein